MLSKERLSRLHNVMAAYVASGQVPGLVTVLSRGNELQVDTIGSDTRRDSIFRIASLSKAVAAAGAMILVEECKVRLDEPVEKFLPELRSRRVLKTLGSPLEDTVPANRSITLRDLLTFRLGFGLIPAPPGTYPIQKATDDLELGQGIAKPDLVPAPDEWMRRFATLPLMHQPGEKWMYNTGTDLVGVMIARASGQPLEKFLHDRLFDPLGMKDTGFSVPASKTDRLATSYYVDPQTGKLKVFDVGPGGQWSRPPAFPSAAGGMVSTADDYLAFARMLLGKGLYQGRRILSRASVELMTSDQLTPAQKAGSGLTPGFFEDNGWGFGMSVVTRRTDYLGNVGTFGWDGGLGTSFRVDPKEDLIGILLTQAAWTSSSQPPVCRDFWTCTYQCLDGD